MRMGSEVMVFWELGRVQVPSSSAEDRCSSSLKCSNCYMVWGGDFVSPGQQGRISHTDLIIGCLVDLATGLMTFTANGKESNTFFQVSPALSNLAIASSRPSIPDNPSRHPAGQTPENQLLVCPQDWPELGGPRGTT